MPAPSDPDHPETARPPTPPPQQPLEDPALQDPGLNPDPGRGQNSDPNPGPEDPLHQPHDRLFRETFSDPANARGLLEAHLPESVTRKILWESLECVPCSFIDPALAATESDLVFKFLRGDTLCYLYVLLEHQSTEDPFMPYRMARYILGLWARHLRKHPGCRRLPPVFPVVVYQGAAPWKSGTRLRDLIELEPGDPNEQWQLGLEFSVIELFRTGYEELRGTPEGILALRVLKADAVGELLSEPVWKVEEWRKLSGAALYRVMRYIASRNRDREALWHQIEQLKEPRLEEAYMTITEQYWAEGRAAGHAAGHTAGHTAGHAAGREQGLREGEARGETRGALMAKRRAILRTLEIRHGSGSTRTDSLPADPLTDPADPLTDQLGARLEAKLDAIDSGPELDQLFEAALCSASLEDFNSQLPRIP
ncbi:MAG: hypothetical protein RLZZ253_2210 [Verrucomicrobiota bacterium]